MTGMTEIPKNLVKPSSRYIGGDDYHFEVTIGGDDPAGRICVEVLRGDLMDESQYAFAIPPEEAVKLAYQLLTRAHQAGEEIAE